MNVLEVYYCANYLGDQRIIQFCLQQYLKSINESNFEDKREVAEQEKADEIAELMDWLTDGCFDFDKFAASDAQLQRTSVNVVAAALSCSNRVLVKDELTVLEAITKYIQADKKQRNKHIRDLFAKLNYVQLNSPFLNASNVRNSSLVPDNCSDEMLSALKDGLAAVAARRPAAFPAVNRKYWGGHYYVLKDGIYVSRGYKTSHKVLHRQFPENANLTRCNGKIYITGGKRRKICSFDREMYAARETFCYDPVSNKVQQVASMRYARNHHAAISVKGKIYVFGGGNYNLPYPDTSYPVFPANYNPATKPEVYDPERDSWEELQDMPLAYKARIERFTIIGPCCAVKLKNDDILVYAATSDDAIRPQTFNPIKNKWKDGYEYIDKSALAEITTLHRFGDYVMFLGDGKYFWYNPYTREESELKVVPIEVPRGRFAVSGVAVDDKNIWTFVFCAPDAGAGGTRLRMAQFDEVEPGKDLSINYSISIDYFYQIHRWPIHNHVLAI